MNTRRLFLFSNAKIIRDRSADKNDWQDRYSVRSREFNVGLVRSDFQPDHFYTRYIFQVVSNFRSGRTTENIMMNIRDCGELFELDELNPDITNATGVRAVCPSQS